MEARRCQVYSVKDGLKTANDKYVYSSKYVYGPIHRHSEYHTTNSQVCRVGFLSIDESTCKSVRFVLPLRFIHMIDGDACPIRGMRLIGVSYLCWWEGGGHLDRVA